jgi:hypothetical protein
MIFKEAQMSVYGELTIKTDRELDEDLIAVTAGVLQQYILEDGLDQEDKSDKRLEILMRCAERFLRRYVDVVDMHQDDSAQFDRWQTKQIPEFNNHASTYNRIYQPLAHMTEAPYFMTAWSICFLVDSALLEHKVENKKHYDVLSKEEVFALDYTIRFCENLLQRLHSEFFMK